jgi:hypothetical protein
MKQKKNKKLDDSFPSSAQPVELTPEQKRQQEIRHQEWNRITKLQEYSKKLGEFLKSEENEHKSFIDALNTINRDAEWDEYFITNFPIAARHGWVRTGMFAETACRHLRNLAICNNSQAIRTLAKITVEMTETLTELLTKKSPAAKKTEEIIKELNEKCAANMRLEENTELLRDIASELPYWPMLRFRNAAGNAEEQFQLLADNLKLGEKCPLNVSKQANYNLDIPINSFVWKCLRHFQKVHSSIKFGFEYPRNQQRLDSFLGVEKPKKTFEEAIASIVFQIPKVQMLKPRLVGMIPEKDIGIYKVSYDLPPLTKSTAKDWTDKAIMPYVCSRFSDFSKVPEFAGLLKRTDVKTRGQQRKEIRKDILRSLTSLARKA